jgi:chitosanase
MGGCGAVISDLQKRSVQAIVNIFETGRPLGDYGQVTMLPGNSGHLTYGRSQTTLASGNLFLLIRAYCRDPAAQFGEALTAFLGRLEDTDFDLDHNGAFRDLLRAAGDDPVMRHAQDWFFDREFWAPAVRSAEFIGSETALGTAVVYDSRIHGSWHRMRDRTNESHGPLSDVGEKEWMVQYVQVRRDWLANHSNELLRKTVYRMDALKQLMDSKNWGLDLPLEIRGNVIDESVLAGPPECASTAIAEERLLRLRTPFMLGADVRALQEALVSKGFGLDVDGVFGPGTKTAVVAFQAAEGLMPDGIVGPASRSRLGIDL